MLAAGLMACTGVAVADPRCVLPVADGGVKDPSAPALVGVITRLELPRVLIRTEDGRITSVLVDRNTSFFTAYGGGYDETQLSAGQHASVWLKDCAPASGRSRHAAVVTVCSLSPEPCPTK